MSEKYLHQHHTWFHRTINDEKCFAIVDIVWGLGYYAVLYASLNGNIYSTGCDDTSYTIVKKYKLDDLFYCPSTNDF